MFAVMVMPVALGGAAAMAWMLPVFVFGVLLIGSITAPVHTRKLVGAMAVAVGLAAIIALPQIIIRCPEWWWPC